MVDIYQQYHLFSFFQLILYYILILIMISFILLIMFIIIFLFFFSFYRYQLYYTLQYTLHDVKHEHFHVYVFKASRQGQGPCAKTPSLVPNSRFGRRSGPWSRDGHSCIMCLKPVPAKFNVRGRKDSSIL